MTFRDGRHSIFATRMRTEDVEKEIVQARRRSHWISILWKFGVVRPFDVATRFLNEDRGKDPYSEKIDAGHGLQMLLRGQNLVGYRHYADDVVAAFVYFSAEVGIDIFRVFDALNDERNMEASLKAIEEKQANTPSLIH